MRESRRPPSFLSESREEEILRGFFYMVCLFYSAFVYMVCLFSSAISVIVSFVADNQMVIDDRWYGRYGRAFFHGIEIITV